MSGHHNGAGQTGRPRPRRRRLVMALAITLTLIGGAVTVRLYIRPDLAPLPSTVDAIVELAGPNNAARDRLATSLAEEGRAPILIQSTVQAEVGTGACLPATPGVTIRCFHPTPNTTRGEARYIGAMAEHYGWSSIIIITTRDHAWRASLRVSRCFPGEIYVAVSPLSGWQMTRGVVYQMAATVKALTYQRSC